MTTTLDAPRTITETARVLADMLTENTGRHFLDSGGAYGRNWERNAGRDVEVFLDAPRVTLDARFDYLDVTLDVFHWLNDRLEYDAAYTRKLKVFAAAFDPDSPWLATMETFGEAHREHYGRGEFDGCVNSYNGESLLSQVIQYVIFTGSDGEQRIMLQIHGGCDVRGGYTAPKVFRFATYEGVYDMFSDNDYTLYCDAPREATTPLDGMPDADPHVLDCRGGEWITYGGSFTRDPWEDAGVEMIHESEDGEKFVRCPYCAEPHPMSVDVYPVG